MLPRPLSPSDFYHGQKRPLLGILSKRLRSLCREPLSRSDVSSQDTQHSVQDCSLFIEAEQSASQEIQEQNQYR
jgi:hypothetical protein